MSGMLELEASVYEALCEWCLQGVPEERCGLLSGSRIGAAGRVQRMHPIANVAAEPWHRFRMAPVEQKRAYDRMRASGETWVGLFHSHPTAAAEPSDLDRREAEVLEAGLYYLIYSVRDRAVQAYVTTENGLLPVPVAIR